MNAIEYTAGSGVYLGHWELVLKSQHCARCTLYNVDCDGFLAGLSSGATQYFCLPVGQLDMELCSLAWSCFQLHVTGLPFTKT